MCDFGISETIAAVSASIAASTASAASATAAAAGTAASAIGSAAVAAGSAIAEGATALGAALGIGAGGGGGGAAAGATGGALALEIGAGSTSNAALIASATGATAAPGLSLEAGMGIASLVLGAGGAGASGGVSAKQAKEQGTLINAQAKAERRNVLAQANQSSEATAQSNFEVAVAALAARGNVNAANVSDRSVRALTRAVGFQEGTDRATIKRNQEIVNETASARLQGINITKQSQQIQVGNPAVIAGVGAVNAISQGLNSGAGAYQAFSKFRIPTDGPNLAFV